MKTQQNQAIVQTPLCAVNAVGEAAYNLLFGLALLFLFLFLTFRSCIVMFSLFFLLLIFLLCLGLLWRLRCATDDYSVLWWDRSGIRKV